MKSDPQCLRLPGLPLFLRTWEGKGRQEKLKQQTKMEKKMSKEIGEGNYNNVCKIVFVISTIHLQSETIENRWLNLNGIFNIFKQCSLFAAELPLKQRCLVAEREVHTELKSICWLNFHSLLNRRASLPRLWIISFLPRLRLQIVPELFTWWRQLTVVLRIKCMHSLFKWMN